MSSSKRLDIRVSFTLYQWIVDETKKKGFRSKSEFIRYILETMRNTKSKEG